MRRLHSGSTADRRAACSGRIGGLAETTCLFQVARLLQLPFKLQGAWKPCPGQANTDPQAGRLASWPARGSDPAPVLQVPAGQVGGEAHVVATACTTYWLVEVQQVADALASPCLIELQQLNRDLEAPGAVASVVDPPAVLGDLLPKPCTGAVRPGPNNLEQVSSLPRLVGARVAMPGGDPWQIAGKIDCPDGCMVDLCWLLRMLDMEQDAYPSPRPG